MLSALVCFTFHGKYTSGAHANLLPTKAIAVHAQRLKQTRAASQTWYLYLYATYVLLMHVQH